MASVLSLWGEPESSGREAELSVLLREFEEAGQAERARFVFVLGPSGVGKSHLFALLRRALVRRGAAVVEADSAREAKRPFGLFAQPVRQLLDLLHHGGALDEQVLGLSRALSVLWGDGVKVEPLLDRRVALYDQLAELFTAASRFTPAYLLPDLEVADASSLDALRYLAAVASAPESRVRGMFVCSLRDDAALPAPLPELMSRVEGRRLPLVGLDLEGIRSFLSQKELASRVLEATGGNPEAIEALLVQGAKPVDFFSRRAARLSPLAQTVLRVLAAAAAPLGQDAIAGAVARLGLDPASVAQELDQLVRQRLLTVRPSGGRPVYRYARDAERQAFASEQDPDELRRVRRAVGEVLLEASDAVAASALLLEVDPAGSGAKAALLAAEQLASRGAHEEAIALYEQALDHRQGEAAAKVLQRLSQLHAEQGGFRAALSCLLKARRLGGLSDIEASVGAAELLVRLGRPRLASVALARVLADSGHSLARVVAAEVELARGRPEQVLSLGRSVLASLEGESRVRLRSAMGKAQLLRGESAQAEALFSANVDEARLLGNRRLEAMAVMNQGVASHKQGDRAKAMELYRAVGNHYRPAQAAALSNLGSLYAEDGEFELALDHLQRALQAYSRFGGNREVAQIASNLARLYLFLGDLDRAQELSEYALKRSMDVGDAYLEASARLNLGAALLARRESGRSVALFEEARVRFEGVGNGDFAALAAALKARAHLLAGERAQASAELGREAVGRLAAQSAANIEIELVRVELALALGDLHEAGRAVARAREALLGHPDLEGPFRVFFAMGKLRAAAGDASGAQAEMGKAARLLDELVQRVPPMRRAAFLSVAHRAELLGASDPGLRPVQPTPRPIDPSASVHGLVGRSAALRRIVKQLEPIGRSNATVLIRGESGTGKELLAEAIHRLSGRRDMPLVKVNCAAMVEDLLLSELFGHEKGAFTGAIRERKGRFEIADGGTLFLDEIGDISPKAQVALLRVLQEREFERVGGSKTLKVDVRVVCATNRDLEALIEQGRFRQDLYYRLKGVMLELPSLRDRLDDLPHLAEHFLQRLAHERGEPPKHLTQESLELLARHSWPGNVRELENVLASGTIFADGAMIGPDAFSHVAELAALASAAPVKVADESVDEADDDETDEPIEASLTGGELDFYSLARGRGISLKQLRREVELQCIRRALEEAKGNISEAARLLRMKRSRLSQIVNAEPLLKEVARVG